MLAALRARSTTQRGIIIAMRFPTSLAAVVYGNVVRDGEVFEDGSRKAHGK
jgi:hypothetical protein